MGMFFRASCSCGHVNEHVLHGFGFADVPYAPAICHHCQEVISVRTAPKRLRCDKCRRKPELIDLREDERRPSDLVLKCPRCGNKRLRLEPSGLWD